MGKTLTVWLSAVLSIIFLAGSAAADQIQVRIDRIIDGDTVYVSVPQYGQLKVRLLSIDTPELRGKCASEIRKAKAAKRRMAALLPVGSTATLISEPQGWTTDIYGRTLGKIRSPRGRDVGQQLINEGFARPYGGGRRPWCR